MLTKPVGNYETQSVNDFSEYPAEIGDATTPRKTAFPVILQSALARAQGRNSSEMMRCSSTMPYDRYLETPGVRPHADLDLVEAKARLAIEKLFINSLNLVLTVGDHVVQKEISVLHANKQADKINQQDLFLQVNNMDEAEDKIKKAAHTGLLMIWVAVAVTAVASAIDMDLANREPSAEAVALCAYTLADELLDEYGFMKNSVPEMAGLLKKMGFNNKSADLIACILAAVVSMATMMSLTGNVEESSIPAAAFAITENVTWAAQLAAKDSETACEAVCLSDSCNCLVNGLRNKKTIATQAPLPEVAEPAINLGALMNGGAKGPDPIREEMIRYLQDIMTNTRQIVSA